jgi:hypothetical protein
MVKEVLRSQGSFMPSAVSVRAKTSKKYRSGGQAVVAGASIAA